jgi:hypothetical protein
MILENSEDFMYRSFFPEVRREPAGAACFRLRSICDSCSIAYNAFAWVKKMARGKRTVFRGLFLAWGRQNRGREQSLNPVNFLD